MESKIVCIGDSITWGFPYGPDYSWVDIAARDLGIQMINRGINGDTADGLINRLARDVLAYRPTHVMIMIGSNDARIGVTLKAYGKQVANIVAKAMKNKIVPIIGLPVPSGDNWLEYTLVKYRQWLKSFASSGNMGLVDFSPAMSLLNGTLKKECYSDGVHPSKTGYQAMAGVFSEFFTQTYQSFKLEK